MAAGLSKHQRNAMLSEEIGDGTGEVEEVDEPPTTPTPPLPPPTVPPEREQKDPPPPAPPPDVNALIQALVTGIQGGLSNAAAMARDPIPENKTIAGHSVYAHPLGEAHNTKLRCPMFLGIYDEEGKCKPAIEIFEDTSTEIERRALNLVEPGVRPGMERNDGTRATWRVVQHSDDNGQPTRLIIAVPQLWLSQGEYHHMPGMPNLLKQLLVAQGSEDEWTQMLLDLQQAMTAAA
jgi:hypothetical protein